MTNLLFYISDPSLLHLIRLISVIVAYAESQHNNIMKAGTIVDVSEWNESA